jgi:cysteine sulfinate desulfinase/cysteine desulfurase-like protein
VEELGVDTLSIAGHNCFVQRELQRFTSARRPVGPLIHGARHESRRRAGTENVLLDIRLGTACALAEHWIGMESVRRLRDLLEYVPRETWQSHCSQHVSRRALIQYTERRLWGLFLPHLRSTNNKG